MYLKDTIAAVATALGEASIGIVRISGPDALTIASGIFTPSSKTSIFKPQRLYYGVFKDPQKNTFPQNTPIDSGYMVYMKAPKSFTGEDTVELHAHGGVLVLKGLLGVVLARGARAALPGEFTKRAFLNGKLDLTQAEAVVDIIRAKTGAALTEARARLEGGLKKRIDAIKETLLDLQANVEARLDFPEEEVDVLSKEELLKGVESAAEELKKLLSTYEQGRALKEGVAVLILGGPNVGKSSLLNILLKEERAIVTPVPGTTRDIIEEMVTVKGIPLRLMDTAGLRDTYDIAEKIGISRAKARVKEAGLILFVVDSSKNDLNEDLLLLNAVLENGDDPHNRVVIVANKIDLLTGKTNNVNTLFNPYPVVFVSALLETGIKDLEKKIYEEVSGRGSITEAVPGELIATAREKDAVTKSLEAVEKIKSKVADEFFPMELIAEDVRLSVTKLAELTGEITTEEILTRIFNNFCVGK